MTDADRVPSSSGGPRAPVPLLVAVALCAVEGGLLALYGVAEVVASLRSGLLVMGVSTAVFFLVYGAGLVLCGAAGFRLRAWARAPLVLAQLIQMGVAWSFRGGSSTPVAVALAVAAGVTLVGLLHPASTAALISEPGETA